MEISNMTQCAVASCTVRATRVKDKIKICLATACCPLAEKNKWLKKMQNIQEGMK